MGKICVALLLAGCLGVVGIFGSPDVSAAVKKKAGAEAQAAEPAKPDAMKGMDHGDAPAASGSGGHGGMGGGCPMMSGGHGGMGNMGGMGGQMGMMGMMGMGKGGVDAAGLEPEIKEKAEAIVKEFAPKLKEVRADRHSKKAELESVLSSKSPDAGKVKALAKELGEIEARETELESELRLKIAAETGIRTPIRGLGMGSGHGGGMKMGMGMKHGQSGHGAGNQTMSH